MSDDGNPKPAEQSIANALWPLGLTAYAIYRLTRGSLSTTYVIWYVVMAVLGVIFAALAFLARAAGTPRQAAQQIDDMQRSLYAGAHERRLVGDATIDEYRLDRAFYQRATDALTALRFRKLADYVDVEIEKACSKAVIRSFLSADGQIMAGAFDLRMGGLARWLQLFGVLPRKLSAVDLETELTDGTFVTTSDAAQAAKASEFPGISRQFLAPGTPPAELLAAHQQHLQWIISQKPGGVARSSFDRSRNCAPRRTECRSSRAATAIPRTSTRPQRFSGSPASPCRPSNRKWPTKRRRFMRSARSNGSATLRPPSTC
jgi:hypothetical protein